MGSPENPNRPWRRRTGRLAAAALGLGLLAGVLPASAVPTSPRPVAEPSAGDLSPFDAVDQFIGTELDTTQNKSNDAYGNTFPGAAVPFGMVQPSPTTYKVGEGNALVREKGGYEYTADQIRGFGLTRYSGSGCHLRFGGYEFPTIPYAGALREDGSLPVSPDADLPSYFLDFTHDEEESEPGYYAVTTENRVRTELTADTRTAVSRFDFSAAAGSTLLVDAAGANNRVFAADVTIDPATRTVSGSMYGADLCDNGNFYRAYFSTTYDQPFESWGTWDGAVSTAGSTSATKGGTDTGVDLRHDVGAWLTFADNAQVTARTGLSYVSVANAAENREAETADASFDEVRSDARAAWVEALGTLDVTGGTDESRTKLYTGVYHSLLHPNVRNDVNGEYVGYDGAVHTVEEGREFYKNFAGSGWDMYRSQGQLIALLFPDVAADILESMVAVHDQTGSWQPGAGRMQGDNLQIIIATLDDMGIRDYRRKEALAGMLSTQQLPSSNSGRSDALQYFSTGFIENRKGDFATSRVLEYATADFAIAQLAESLGEDDANDLFMARSQSWLDIFDPQTRHIRPRERTGFDRAFDLRGRDGAHGGQFNQSTGYQYGWNVPHNLAELIERRGGRAASERALDVLMEQLDAGAYTQTGNYLSNQAAFPTPWVYAWLGAPHKTTDVLHRADAEMYDVTPKGLPGNDDQGALSSWYVFSQIGMYPAIYGTGDMVLTAPRYERIVIDPVDSDRVITVTAPGVSPTSRYATGLKVDGTAQSRSWVDASFVREGGSLEFTVGATPGSWGTGAEDLPPSYGEGEDARNNVGTTPAGARNMGSMDLSDWSFSRETLAARGAGPGAAIPHPGTGVEFTWPETAPGQADNWIPHGQRVDLPDEKAATISFLGLATNGPSTGTAVVEYTDGSTQQVRVTFADWSNANPGAGNTVLLTVNGRNNANGSTGGGDFRVFGTRPAPLDPSKTVDAVRLPEAGYSGVMHVFDVATSQEAYADPNAPDGTPDRVILTAAEDPTTAQYVTWRSTSALPLDGKVQLRPVGGEATTVDAEEKPERELNGYPSRSHSARLTQLTPGTAYEYRVGAGSTWSDWATFTTAEDGDEPFTFLYFGDAQEGIDTVWPASVKAAWTATPEAELSIYAGDMTNISTNETEWDDWFSGLGDRARTSPAIATPGNHEVGPEPFMEHYLDIFEYDANGPVAADAGPFEKTYGEHIASVLKDSAYYTDYQGVRFVTMNANRDNICEQITPPGLTTFNCDTGRHVWMAMQAEWLDRVLSANPHRWSVVTAHQPVFSNGISDSGAFRDEDTWRRYVGPVIERHDVDLVLQGHDHAYGRGVMRRNVTERPGVSTGPVYVVANAGQKQYRLTADDDNVWTRNNGVRQVGAQDTSTFQRIRVEGDTLRYESVVTYVEAGGKAPKAVGETLDRFTITKYDGGKKWVTEAGVPAPGPDVPSESVAKPSGGSFDPGTFGEVVWDDDFSADRLSQYSTRAGGEPAAELSVDTARGVLTGTAADGRRWSHLAPPVDGSEKWALIVEPRSFAETGAGEDSLFVGASADNRNLLLNWYNHSGRATGYDFARDGGNRATGRANTALRFDAGDRIAFVHDHGQVSSWIEENGSWRRYNVALASYVLDDGTLASWKPTFSLRLDPGSIAIDRVTVLNGTGAPAPDPVTPEPITFDDRPGTSDDVYVVPSVEGVEYRLGGADGAVVAAGTHPGRGTVTVVAVASGAAPIADGATTQWSHTFSSGGGEVPEVEDTVVRLTITGREYGLSSRVSGRVTVDGAPVDGRAKVAVDGRVVRGLESVAVVRGALSVRLPASLAAGRHTVTVAATGTGARTGRTSVVLRIAKARPALRVAVSPSTVKIGRRASVVVRVALPGRPVTVTGTVRVVFGGRTVSARLVDGKATLRLPRWSRPGVRTLSVQYLGSTSVHKAATRATVRVVR